MKEISKSELIVTYRVLCRLSNSNLSANSNAIVSVKNVIANLIADEESRKEEKC